MTWDPVFNSILKEKMNCVASEEFSEGGKYPVDRLKANLTALSVVGCGLGDRWKHDSESAAGCNDARVSSRDNDTMKWFCETVKTKLDLPLVIKGIMHPDDAILALENGADGIIVSNHGGRQVDGSLSTIEAFPSVIKAVRDNAFANGREPIPVFIDSGVRYGQHVVKALALGATGVLVGRLPIIGASLGGVSGVRHVMLSLLADMQCTMVNCGQDSVMNLQQKSMTSSLVVRSASAGPAPFL